MKLKRLKLENWRGVGFRELEFDEGVTLVEGPNETGKSSLVEALLALIRYKSSSAARDVKAVQPVGEDVGSTVEAEIESGDYRFIYSKTYNREKGTTLRILAPRTEQLTGDEAHGRVEQILNDTVDLGLWEALLVDQGEKIAPVDIKDSAGLSKALDEAAGAALVGEDDTDLFDAVRDEYEKYFTPRAGKAKFESDMKAVDAARADVKAAGLALRDVEHNAIEQQRLASDVRLREQQLPGLKASAERYERQWRDIDAVRSEVKLREQELEAAGNTVAAAQRALEEREALVRAIRDAEQTIAGEEATLEPGRSAIESIRSTVAQAGGRLRDLKASRTGAREAMSTAQADVRHLRQRQQLDGLVKTLRTLESNSAELERSAAIVAAISIDEKGLRAVRESENELRVLESQRDIAATTVVIEAEQDQEIGIGDDTQTVPAAESVERQVTSPTTIRIPGVVRILVEPPVATSDLEARVADARSALRDLCKQYDVADAEDAAARLVRKQTASAALDEARRREQVLLDGRSAAELEEQQKKLSSDLAAYREVRSSKETVPASVEEAEGNYSRAQSALDGIEKDIQAEELRVDGLEQRLSSAVADTEALESRLIGERARLEEKRERLARAREAADDAELASALEEARLTQSRSKELAHAARAKLDALQPDRIRALFENANASYGRAESELASAKTELAILEDRLEQSQANGRFEALEQAERDLVKAESAYASVRRRADAAERLFTTLSRHRDGARKAYVRPLREAIERLGKIVFGHDFEIALNEDWTIETRTLDGKTLGYESLSVGAREQLGILTRLAAAQIVSAHGGVPLIIDDALGFSDPARLETMGAAIAEAGKHSQVVILTCAPGRFSSVGTAKVARIESASVT